jgi:hypothetical protein
MGRFLTRLWCAFCCLPYYLKRPGGLRTQGGQARGRPAARVSRGGRHEAGRRPAYPGGQVQGGPAARVPRRAGPKRPGGPRTQGGRPEAGRRPAHPGGQA